MTKQGNLWNDGPPGPGYIESWARNRGHIPVMGVDEAGRGCLAGPVVAAATILPDEWSLEGLNDSKQMTKTARDRAYDRICDEALAWGVGVVEALRIDRVGILPATLEAMRSAVESAVENYSGKVGLVVVDGTATIPGVTILQKAWAKGDGLSVNCAGASVLAKVTRDRMMMDFGSRFPGYGFERHKGYGTSEHLAAIRKMGPCPIHRMTFAPLKKPV